MRLAVVQTNPAFGAVARNIERAVALMESQKADLYVLPELCTTGYNFIDRDEVLSLAESVAHGLTVESFVLFCKVHSSFVVYGFAEREGDRTYNSAALVGPQGLIGRYRKVHLFDREVLLFEPGDLGFPVFDTPLGKIGMMICFDWIYPESARTLTLNGAQLIAHPSNLVMPYCPDAMVTRCLENRVFAATADRVGVEDRGGHRLVYIGKSEIVSPQGNILIRLGDQEESIAVADVELSEALRKKINQHNDLLRGRRPDAYTT